MANNEVFKVGNNVSLPVPVGTKSGDPVRIGGLNGVAQTDEPTAWLNGKGAYVKHPSGNIKGYASVKLDGAHSFQLGTGVIAVGDAIYITSANALNTTSSGNSLFGHALTAKASAAGKVVVRITN